MFLSQPFKIKNFVVLWFVFETFSLTALIPWMMISTNYQDKILYKFFKPSPELFSDETVGYIFTGMTIFGTIGYLLYEIVKRRANKIIYKQ